MAYTINEHIAIATSYSPLQSFKNNGKALPFDVREIAPYVFFNNGKIYMYYADLKKITEYL